MNLSEALEILRTATFNPQRNEEAKALEVLKSELERMVGGVTNQTQYHAQAVDRVYEKIVDQVISRDLPEIHSPASYFRRALQWRVIELIRKEKARERGQQQAAIEQALAEAEKREEQRREDAWDRLREIYTIVLRSTDQRYKESNAMAMKTLELIHRDDYTLKEALIKIDPTLESDRLKQETERIHKAHQRLQRRIKEETKAQVEAGRLNGKVGEDILWLLQQIRRCPNRNPFVRLLGE